MFVGERVFGNGKGEGSVKLTLIEGGIFFVFIGSTCVEYKEVRDIQGVPILIGPK